MRRFRSSSWVFGGSDPAERRAVDIPRECGIARSAMKAADARYRAHLRVGEFEEASRWESERDSQGQLLADLNAELADIRATSRSR